MDSDYSGSDYSGVDTNSASGWGLDGDGAFAGSNDWGGPDGGMDTTLQSLYGYDGTQGSLGGYDGPTSGNYSEGFDKSDPSMFDDLAQFFTKNPIGRFTQGLISRANPTLGMVTGMATRANTVGNSPTRGGALGTIGGFAGGMLGSMAGPAGAVAGSYAGSQMGQAMGGNSPSYSGPTGQQQAGEMGGSGMGLLGGGLGALYQNYKNNQNIGGQINTLQGMYGQNSPYAQALRQQLARRDAVAGRRSQYGPREVELQAALARAASGNAGTLSNLYQQKMNNRTNFLNTIGYGVQQAGGVRGIYDGLRGLFGGGQGMEVDPGGYGIGNTFDTGSYNDIIPDVWGG